MIRFLIISLLFLLNKEIEGTVYEEVWSQGRIPFVINSDIQDTLRNDFQWAMRRIEYASCVKFTSRMPGEKFIEIRRGNCSEPKFDYRGVGVIITANENCLHSNRAYAEYQLGRAIGFHVEYTRYDRDKYMEIENKTRCRDYKNSRDFEKENADFAFSPIEFDYLSHLMKRSKCYKAKEPFGPSNFGSGNGTLSVVDIEKLNAVYACPGCYSFRFHNKDNISSNLFPVVGGFDASLSKTTNLYICRFYHKGSLIPGKSNAEISKCWIHVEDEEISTDENFSIFVNPYKERRLVWVKKTKQDIENDTWIPENAIVGGRTVDQEPLYIGRCYLVGRWPNQRVVSKIQKSTKEFKVPYGSAVHDCSKEFEVLTCIDYN